MAGAAAARAAIVILSSVALFALVDSFLSFDVDIGALIRRLLPAMSDLYGERKANRTAGEAAKRQAFLQKSDEEKMDF